MQTNVSSQQDLQIARESLSVWDLPSNLRFLKAPLMDILVQGACFLLAAW